MKIKSTIFSNYVLELDVYSIKRQLIHVRVTNLVSKPKLSFWEIIQKGENKIQLDISTLEKGLYRINVDFPTENTRADIFTVY